MKSSSLRRLAAFCRALRLVLVLLGFAKGSHAATITKAPTGTDLTAGASWGGTAPGSGNVAT